MSDRKIGLVLLVISGAFYVQTFFFKSPPFAAFQGMGAGFFPRGILIALAVLSLILLIKGEGSLLPRMPQDGLRAAAGRYRDVIISLFLFPVYVAGIQFFGFVYSTIVYLVVMQLALYPRKGLSVLYVAAGSVVFTYAITELLQRYLHVILPAGSLF